MKPHRTLHAMLVLTVAQASWPLAVRAAPGDTELVSVHYAPATQTLYSPTVTAGISGDGRFVLFASRSPYVVPPDGTSTGILNLLVRDRVGERTFLANLSSTGRPVESSAAAVISASGRYVAFLSYDDQVVSGDTNNASDVFLRDLQAGTTQRVSISSTGGQYQGISSLDMSSDGRYVAFSGSFDQTLYLRDRLTRQTHEKYVSGLRTPVRVSDDGRYLAYANYDRLLVHDRSTNRNDLVNVNAAGQRANDHCYLADMSVDGRFVVFVTRASNLVPGDTSDTYDVFLRDRALRRTERVSVASDERPLPVVNAYLNAPRVSADGRHVVFLAANRTIPGPGGNYSLVINDVYRRDRAKGTTWLASANSNGVKANDTSLAPFVSDDGRFVAFTSTATNLSPLDGDEYQDAYVHQFWVAPLP